MESDIIYIDNLPIERWEEFKNLRLESLTNDPEAFSETLEQFGAKSEETWRAMLERKSKEDRDYVFAEHNGKLIGMGSIYHYPKENVAHNAWFDSLYVSPEYRKKGVGIQLVLKRLDLLSKYPNIIQAICEIYSSQKASLEMHKKLDFDLVGTMKDFICLRGEYFDKVTFQKRVK